jgi:hypothetical protein
MLMAEKIQNIRAVVTIDGNLDPAAWAHIHGFSALRGSLNPSRRPPLNPRIFQVHLAGGRDTNIPVSMLQAAVARQRNAQLLVVPAYDHWCCWQDMWPSVLAALDSPSAASRQTILDSVSWTGRR